MKEKCVVCKKRNRALHTIKFEMAGFKFNFCGDWACVQCAVRIMKRKFIRDFRPILAKKTNVPEIDWRLYLTKIQHAIATENVKKQENIHDVLLAIGVVSFQRRKNWDVLRYFEYGPFTSSIFPYAMDVRNPLPLYFTRRKDALRFGRIRHANESWVACRYETVIVTKV